MTHLGNIVFWPFLTKTKREQPLLGHIHGKIWPHSLQFALWFLGPKSSIEACLFGLFSPSFQYCGHSYYRNGNFWGPKPSSYIGLLVMYPFLPLPGTYPGFQGSENAYFMARTRLKWLGCSRLDQPTWKVSSAPYHTPMHERAWIRTIIILSRHISRVPGVQK